MGARQSTLDYDEDGCIANPPKDAVIPPGSCVVAWKYPEPAPTDPPLPTEPPLKKEKIDKKYVFKDESLLKTDKNVNVTSAFKFDTPSFYYLRATSEKLNYYYPYTKMTTIVLTTTMQKSGVDKYVLENDLYKKLQVQDDWVVALSEMIYYPSSFQNIREPYNYIDFEFGCYEKFTGNWPIYFRRWKLTKNAKNEMAISLVLPKGERMISSVCDVDDTPWKQKTELTWFWADSNLPIDYSDRVLAFEGVEEKEKFKKMYLKMVDQRTYTKTISHRFFIKPDVWQFVNDVVRELNLAVAEFSKTVLALHGEPPNAVELPFHPFYPFWSHLRHWYCGFALHKGRIIFISHAVYAKHIDLRIRLPTQLLYLLGFIPALGIDPGWQKIVPSAFYYDDLEELVQQWYEAGEPAPAYWYAPYAPDFGRNTFKALWVYSDVIEPNMIGDTMSPLLRVIPSDQQPSLISYAIFGNLHYCSLSRSELSSIRVWFKEDPKNAENLLINGEVIVRLQFLQLRND